MGRLSFLRYISIVGAAFSFIGSGFMFYLGSESTIKTVLAYFKRSPTTEKYVHLTDFESTLVSIIEAVDLFLFAFVLFIFSFGILHIFVLMGDGSEITRHKWMHIESVSDLKTILIEVIIVILTVLFLKNIIIHFDKLSWGFIVIPVGVVLLSLSLFLVKKSRNVDKGLN